MMNFHGDMDQFFVFFERSLVAEVPKSLDLDLDCNMLICNGLSSIA